MNFIKRRGIRNPDKSKLKENFIDLQTENTSILEIIYKDWLSMYENNNFDRVLITPQAGFKPKNVKKIK